MRKIALFLLSLFVLASFVAPQKAYAAACADAAPQGVGTTLPANTDSHTISANLSNYYEAGKKYQFIVFSSQSVEVIETSSPAFTIGENGTFNAGILQNGTVTVQGNKVSWKLTDSRALTNDNLVFSEQDPHYVALIENPPYAWYSQKLCDIGSYKTSSQTAAAASCNIYVWQERGGKECYASGPSGCLTAGNVTTHMEVQGVKNADGSPYNGSVTFELGADGLAGAPNPTGNIANGVGSTSFRASNIGSYNLTIRKHLSGMDVTSPGTLGSGDTRPPGTALCAPVSFQTSSNCGENACAPRGVMSQAQSETNFELCSQIGNEQQAEKCRTCLAGNGSGGKQGIWTAIGCIPTAPTGIIQTLIRLALGLGGGVTLLLILAGAFRLSVSQGDPKAAEEAKEQITSAVIGLLFIIFSVVMLRFIGIQVLQIPGFGG